MTYEILIKRKETIRSIVRGEYCIIETRPWTDADLKDRARAYEDDASILREKPLKEVRGYAPDREGTTNTEVEVYKQTVDRLDLVAVINAVNSLSTTPVVK